MRRVFVRLQPSVLRAATLSPVATRSDDELQTEEESCQEDASRDVSEEDACE